MNFHACDVDEGKEDTEEDHEAELEVCEHERVDDDDADGGHAQVPDHLVPDRLVRRPGGVGLHSIVWKLWGKCRLVLRLREGKRRNDTERAFFECTRTRSRTLYVQEFPSALFLTVDSGLM